MGTTVVLADAATAWRRHARQALEEKEVAVVGEAFTAQATVDLVIDLRPQVLLLDIAMCGGLSAVWDLAVRAPDVAMLIVTAARDDEATDVVAAMRAGARGYVYKLARPTALLSAIQAVLAGEIALPRHLVEPLVLELRRQNASRTRRQGVTATLTAREWEVLDLLRQGLGTTQMARQLFVSPGTVRTHLASVQHKLKVDSRAGALRVLADAGVRSRVR